MPADFENPKPAQEQPGNGWSEAEEEALHRRISEVTEQFEDEFSKDAIETFFLHVPPEDRLQLMESRQEQVQERLNRGHEITGRSAAFIQLPDGSTYKVERLSLKGGDSQESTEEFLITEQLKRQVPDPVEAPPSEEEPLPGPEETPENEELPAWKRDLEQMRAGLPDDVPAEEVGEPPVLEEPVPAEPASQPGPNDRQEIDLADIERERREHAEPVVETIKPSWLREKARAAWDATKEAAGNIGHKAGETWQQWRANSELKRGSVDVLEQRLQSDALSAKDRQVVEQTYARKLTTELAKGKELGAERLEYLFKDLVKRGAESALAELGTRVEGFKNFQQAMVKLGVEDDVVIKETGQRVERKMGMLDKIVERIPNRPAREAVRSAVKSGAIGAGALAVIGLCGGPVSWVAFGGSVLGAAGARFIASHHAREKKLFTPTKEELVKDGEKELIVHKSIADQAKAALLKKLGEVHARAQGIEEKLEGTDEAKLEARAAALKEIVLTLRQRDEAALETFRKGDTKARRWENLASFAGGLVGGGLFSYFNNYSHALAEAKEKGVRMVGENLTSDASKGHVVRFYQGDWHYQYEPKDAERINDIFERCGEFAHGYDLDARGRVGEVTDWLAANHEVLHTGVHRGVEQALLKQELITGMVAAGALGVGQLWDGVATARNSYWNRRQAAKALGQAYSQTQEFAPGPVPPNQAEGAGFDVGREQGAKRDADLISRNLGDTIRTNLDFIITTTRQDDPVERLRRGEGVLGPEDIRTMNWLLGTFTDREQLIREAPGRLVFAERYLTAQQEQQVVGSKEFKRTEDLLKLCKEIRENLTKDGFLDHFTELSEQLRYEHLHTRFNKASEYVFDGSGAAFSVVQREEYADVVLAKAGLPGLEQAEIMDLRQLGRYFELYPEKGMSDNEKRARAYLARLFTFRAQERQRSLDAERRAGEERQQRQQRQNPEGQGGRRRGRGRGN